MSKLETWLWLPGQRSPIQRIHFGGWHLTGFTENAFGSADLFEQIGKLVVDVLGFNFQFLFTGFANPAVFSIDEGVVVDAFTVVFGADVTLHTK